MAASKSKAGGAKGKSRVVAEADFEEIIVDLPAVEQLDKDYFAYGQQVIEDRAVPSAADGLKPVHRRILWDMHIQRLFPDRPFVKTARVVGDTMALFHPHGDQSIADALTRLAQPFANLVPLLDFHGNYGSPDFSPAAARYTETRLGFAGMLLLDDIDQRTVPMVENYEGSTEEPVVLPAAFPHLLVNGANGIAVGLSSYLPPHDPREVCAATLHLIANPKATVDELMEFLPGPSFPQECTITNGDEMTDIYRAGVGRVVVRGAWNVEELGRGRQQLVVTSLPYADTTTGSTEKFIAAVGDAIDEGNLAGIVDYNDESSDGATRLTLGLANGITAEQVIPALLRWTNLQVTNKVQMHFLDEHSSVRLYNLRSCIQAWIDHRVRVIIRRSEHRLEKIEDRLHRLRGFLAVLLDIDRTIAIVRSSKTRAIARASLMAEFDIDEGQANAVLDLNLGQLTEDAVIEFKKEAIELEKEAAKLRRLLGSPTALRRQVGTELEAVIPQFDGVAPRVTTITTEVVQRVSKAAMVLDEPVTVLVDANGYVQAQRSGSKAKPKLEPLRSFDTSTAQNLVVITASGQLHRALAATIPADKPTAAVNVFAGLDPTDRILGWWADQTFPTDLLLVTSDGQVKRIEGDDLAGGDRKGGISLVKVATGARVVQVLVFDGAQPVLLVTQGGQAVRFLPDDVRPMGRSASGVRGVKLVPGDAVVGAAHPAADDDRLLVVQAKGAAKRVMMSEIPVQGRGTKGVKCAVVTPRSGQVSAVCGTTDASTVLVRDAEGAIAEVSVGAFTAAARDASGGKVRGFDGVITGFETI
ncbi:MAG: DNA topoisomerase (ATP-hydrolyzing) subunit A [Actinobacteria bacterium]|nr:DNA topoisomerase (ATP-hydrolyzing) subunit A [Actinomycetota bacterium]